MTSLAAAAHPPVTNRGADLKALTGALCAFDTGVVAPDNEAFFRRLGDEVPLRLERHPSGARHLGWIVPPRRVVRRAVISRDGTVLYDGAAHPLGVAAQSRGVRARLAWEDLRPHLVSDADRPDAVIYHCAWQYRPWDADWAFCVPHRLVSERFGPGTYDVELDVEEDAADMLVGIAEHRGTSDRVIVLNAHTCHPGQANDDMAGVAILVRLLQSLAGRRTHYTYRAVFAPEHLGTVFHLSTLDDAELDRLVSGLFVEMPGTPGAPLKAASTFLGGQPIDVAVRHAARMREPDAVDVPWRSGAGNDETVWEAPGIEVPFVELSRCLDTYAPFATYHSDGDTADALDPDGLAGMFDTLADVIDILERNATLHRRFNGLPCLSNPDVDLYFERPDPAIAKDIDDVAERWGRMLDSLLRAFDGRSTVLDVAVRHGLPFRAVYDYLDRFVQRGLLRMAFAPIERVPRSTMDEEVRP